MKKLLALMLVLCLASAASATLSMDVSGTVDVMVDTTLTITVSSDSSDQAGYSGYIIIEEGWDGTLSNGQKLSGAGNLGSIGWYTEGGWGAGYEMVAGSNQSDLVAGAQFTVDFDATGMSYGDQAFVSLWLDPDYDNAQGTVTLNVIPEPMTIALLGLGGLLLRRRK